MSSLSSPTPDPNSKPQAHEGEVRTPNHSGCLPNRDRFVPMSSVLKELFSLKPTVDATEIVAFFQKIFKLSTVDLTIVLDRAQCVADRLIDRSNGQRFAPAPVSKILYLCRAAFERGHSAQSMPILRTLYLNRERIGYNIFNMQLAYLYGLHLIHEGKRVEASPIIREGAKLHRNDPQLFDPDFANLVTWAASDALEYSFFTPDTDDLIGWCEHLCALANAPSNKSREIQGCKAMVSVLKTIALIHEKLEALGVNEIKSAIEHERYIDRCVIATLWAKPYNLYQFAESLLSRASYLIQRGRIDDAEDDLTLIPIILKDTSETDLRALRIMEQVSLLLPFLPDSQEL